MGHDGHFLDRLDRVAREQTELALALYRDHEAVRHLLEHEKVPDDAPRVAIALEDGDKGPYVIVARDGHFVTCLGSGMSPRPWVVLPRKALVGSLGFASDMRRRKKVAEEIGLDGEDVGDLLSRITKRKNLLSREEIVGISAFAPLFAHGLYVLSAGRSAEIVKGAILAPHPRRDPASIDRHVRQVWAAAYGLELCGTVEERVARPVVESFPADFSFSIPTSHLSDFTFVLRGLWAAGMVGPMLVASYFERFDRARSAMKAFDATLALTTIALRHEDARAEIVRDLVRRKDVSSDRSLAGFYTACVQSALSTIEHVDESEAMARSLGASLYEERARERLEPGDLGYVASKEDVPSDLAETAFLNAGGSIEADPEWALAYMFPATTMLAKVSVGAFHYPSALVRSLVDPWGEAEVRAHYQQLRGPRGAPKPTVYDARIGRNEPCPCGSGKKFKKCCAP